MANMQKDVVITDENLVELKNLSSKVFKNNLTIFSKRHTKFANEVADLASKLYESRGVRDIDFCSKVSLDERLNMMREIKALALTSYMCENSNMNYELAFEYTNASVSRNLKHVVMDKTNLYVDQLGNKLAALCKSNSYWNCEPLFVFLARAIVTAKTLGADVKSHQNYTDIGDLIQYKNALWGTYHTLTQFMDAQVGDWSEAVKNELEDSCSIVTNWCRSNQFPKVRFCCGCGFHHIDWKLDMNLYDPVVYNGDDNEDDED